MSESNPSFPATHPRVEPPFAADEVTMLRAWLDFHRATLLAKCEGLDADALTRRSVPPSSLSLLGLLRHMTDVEIHWFRRILAGQDVPDRYVTDDDVDGDFNVAEGADPGETLTAFLDEVQACREVAAGFDLDAVARRGPRPVTLRWIYVHLIEEYARHNGHADLLRECLDGVTGV